MKFSLIQAHPALWSTLQSTYNYQTLSWSLDTLTSCVTLMFGCPSLSMMRSSLAVDESLRMPPRTAADHCPLFGSSYWGWLFEPFWFDPSPLPWSVFRVHDDLLNRGLKHGALTAATPTKHSRDVHFADSNRPSMVCSDQKDRRIEATTIRF